MAAGLVVQTDMPKWHGGKAVGNYLPQATGRAGLSPWIPGTSLECCNSRCPSTPFPPSILPPLIRQALLHCCHNEKPPSHLTP